MQLALYWQKSFYLDPIPRAALHGYLSSVKSDDFFGDGKAKTGSSVLSRSRFFQAIELFKDFTQLFLRDPGKGVGDYKATGLIFLVNFKADCAVFDVVFDRIVENVD